MKPKNFNEILNKYLTFLAYFTVLLSTTVICGLLYFKTHDSYAAVINQKKTEVELFNNNSAKLIVKMDSLNNYMSMLNTKLVANEAALEREILKLKKEALNDINALEKQGNNDYIIYKKMLLDVDKILSTKKELQQVKEEEENIKKKLMDCNKSTSDLLKRSN